MRNKNVRLRDLYVVREGAQDMKRRTDADVAWAEFYHAVRGKKFDITPVTGETGSVAFALKPFSLWKNVQVAIFVRIDKLVPPGEARVTGGTHWSKFKTNDEWPRINVKVTVDEEMMGRLQSVLKAQDKRYAADWLDWLMDYNAFHSVFVHEVMHHIDSFRMSSQAWYDQWRSITGNQGEYFNSPTELNAYFQSMASTAARALHGEDTFDVLDRGVNRFYKWIFRYTGHEHFEKALRGKERKHIKKRVAQLYQDLRAERDRMQRLNRGDKSAWAKGSRLARLYADRK